MEELDIPILRKAYELYKTFHGLRGGVPKADRYTLWQRAENIILEILEGIFLAGQLPKAEKLRPLEHVSVKLNMLRLLLRLAKDTKAIDLKKYVSIQGTVDEVGRMLGGWIKAAKDTGGRPPPHRKFLREERRKCRADGDPMLSLASSFQLLKLSWSPFQFAFTQLPSTVCMVPVPVWWHCGWNRRMPPLSAAFHSGASRGREAALREPPQGTGTDFLL